MNRAIQQNTAQNRFEWTEDQTLSVLDYQLADGVMALTHTLVPKALEGRGIAGDLTKFALDTARAQGWKVDPVCSYASTYIRRHPEYQDLIA